MKKTCAFFAVVLAFVVLSGAVAVAKGIKVQNDTNIKLKSLECFGEHSVEPDSLVLKDLAAGSSVNAPIAKFPEHLCSRLVLTMENGRKWQFFTEHEVASLESFSFELSPISRHSKDTVPMYTAKAGDYLEQQVAGLPLFIMAQFIGIAPLEKYSEWITPRTKLASDNADVLAFAGYTWNITKDSLVIKNNTVEKVRFEVPFMITPANIATLDKDLDSGNFELYNFIVDGVEKSTEKKGADAIDEAFMQCSSAKNCQINFYNSSNGAELFLLNGQSMQLELSSGIPLKLFRMRQAKSNK